MSKGMSVNTVDTTDQRRQVALDDRMHDTLLTTLICAPFQTMCPESYPELAQARRLGYVAVKVHDTGVCEYRVTLSGAAWLEGR